MIEQDPNLPDPTIDHPGPGAFYWISTGMFLVLVAVLIVWASVG